MIDPKLLDNLSEAKRQYERTVDIRETAEKALDGARDEHLKAYQALLAAQSAVFDAA
jgi:exonuclease VII small subunit